MPDKRKILKLGNSQETRVVEEYVEKPHQDSGRGYFLTQTTEIGFAIAVPICGGALFGVWLDRKFGTQPEFTLSFLFVGIVLAFVSLFHTAGMFSKKQKK